MIYRSYNGNKFFENNFRLVFWRETDILIIQI